MGAREERDTAIVIETLIEQRSAATVHRKSAVRTARSPGHISRHFLLAADDSGIKGKVENARRHGSHLRFARARADPSQQQTTDIASSRERESEQPTANEIYASIHVR